MPYCYCDVHVLTKDLTQKFSFVTYFASMWNFVPPLPNRFPCLNACLFVCLCVYDAHPSLLCIGQYTSLFRQTNTLRGIVVQRVGMTVYPPTLVRFPTAGDGRNSSVARPVDPCVLAGRHEKNVNDDMLGVVYYATMNAVHFHCHCRNISTSSFHAVVLVRQVYVFMRKRITVSYRK